MTPKRLSLNPRRIATLTVAGLILLAPLAWIVWCFYAAAGLDDSIAVQSRQLDGLTRRIEALKAATNGHPEEADLSATVYFAGETPAIAGAAIQERMTDTITGQSGRIIESQVIPPDPSTNDPGGVDFRVSFDIKVAGLQHILHSVETGSPFMFLRSIDVRSLSENEADLDTDPTLRVEMVVAGYQRTGTT